MGINRTAMQRFILVIPLRGEYLTLVRQALDVLLRQTKTPVERKNELQLVVNEACNVINYAHSGRKTEKVVSVTAGYENKLVMVTVEESSKGPDGHTIRKRVAGKRLPLEGKFSLQLLEELATTLQLSSGIAGGARIELTKRL